LQAQQQLDKLHSSIFERKTPSFPEEDKKEAEVQEAKAAFDEAQCKVQPEKQAVKILSEAMRSIHEAIEHMDQAMSRSQAELLSNENAAGEAMDKHPLSRAQTAASQSNCSSSKHRSYHRRLKISLPCMCRKTI